MTPPRPTGSLSSLFPKLAEELSSKLAGAPRLLSQLGCAIVSRVTLDEEVGAASILLSPPSLRPRPQRRTMEIGTKYRVNLDVGEDDSLVSVEILSPDDLTSELRSMSATRTPSSRGAGERSVPG